MTSKSTVFFAVGGVALALGVALRGRGKQKELKDDAEDTFEKHICEHDGNGLVALHPDSLWHVNATFKGNGPPWRRMLVYRPTGTKSLILLSPTAVPFDTMAAIEELGTVEVLIIPNSYHRADAAVFKKRYPNAKVACPPGWVRKGVSEVVPVDMDSRELEEKFKGFIKVVRIGGLCDHSKPDGDFAYAYEFHLSDGMWARVCMLLPTHCSISEKSPS